MHKKHPTQISYCPKLQREQRSKSGGHPFLYIRQIWQWQCRIICHERIGQDAPVRILRVVRRPHPTSRRTLAPKSDGREFFLINKGSHRYKIASILRMYGMKAFSRKARWSPTPTTPDFDLCPFLKR